MRIAFYAPLNAPIDGTPSGDRRVAILLTQALRLGGHDVVLASTFRSFDGAGERLRQVELRDQGRAVARTLIERWRGSRDAPQLWFTYHLYYKAPDWLGPMVSEALDIPYVVAEASHAGKRAGGPWALGHEACERAILKASLLFCPTRFDMPALAALLGSTERIVHLPPFLDVAWLRDASKQRAGHRQQLAAAHGLDGESPWLLAVGMMRLGDKLASYRALGRTLALVADLRWLLLVAGDGPARAQVTSALAQSIPGRTTFLGELDEAAIATVYAAADLLVWPAVNEAYGMALLEAQCAGLPVVAANTHGVPDVVQDGQTGLLAPAGDCTAMAACVRALLTAPQRRLAMACAAADFVARERSLEVTARRLANWGQGRFRFTCRINAPGEENGAV